MKAPRFWTSSSASWQARFLAPLSWAFNGVGLLRQKTSHPWRAPVPVLCCGNLTVGGTGKTILVQELAKRLIARGERPHILSRGYKSRLKKATRVCLALHTAQDVGDETFMLAQQFPVWIGARRDVIAQRAINAGATCLLMDDGLQNFSLHKTLSLITVDAALGFGNGRVLPAGPLREPLSRGMARTDALILIGQHDSETTFRPYPIKPVLYATLYPSTNLNILKGVPLVAFAGIGRPEKFFKMLDEAGLTIRLQIDFPDHHAYSGKECEKLRRRASKIGAKLVTTRKDWVKLPESFRHHVEVIDVEMSWSDPASPERLLDQLFKTP